MDRVLVPEAKIPAINNGQLRKPFEVRVVNVSNPYLFYVQPLETLTSLNSLERSLKVSSSC